MLSDINPFVGEKCEKKNIKRIDQPKIRLNLKFKLAGNFLEVSFLQRLIGDVDGKDTDYKLQNVAGIENKTSN